MKEEHIIICLDADNPQTQHAFWAKKTEKCYKCGVLVSVSISSYLHAGDTAKVMCTRHMNEVQGDFMPLSTLQLEELKRTSPR